MKNPEDTFYHQNIQDCIEDADIHIYNADIFNGKYYQLTNQIIKYISLILHPGLVTPTHIEACMQLAYNAKFNSGCLSRQVGAVVTREDYSIQSVGWNDVPKGQIPCSLRDVSSYVKNKDAETFSQYELEDDVFSKILIKIDNSTARKTRGRCMAFCFKDVYNGITDQKNQVYTRALHAEENAFLQISKYGGTHVKGGYLFTTASPCELCAKKAYQLGIKHIYYINPYPGISQKHILTFGNRDNPEMKLFYGAIGQAYLDFYEPRISAKDELELLTGVNIKKVVRENINDEKLYYDDIIYKEMDIELKFCNDRNSIESIRKVKAIINKEDIKKISKHIIWTGSAYDGTKLWQCQGDDEDVSIVETSKNMPYTYDIMFKNQTKKGDKLNYSIITYLKDERNVMEPYFAHMIKHKIETLIIRIIAPKRLIKEVRTTIYADLDMSLNVSEESIKEIENTENEVIYQIKIQNANVNYTYAIEWSF